MVADNKAAKALKKQQALLKDVLKTYVANAADTATRPSLLLSVLYEFTTGARIFIAVALPALL